MSAKTDGPLGLASNEGLGRDEYAVLLRSAAEIFQRTGSVDVGYEALRATMLNVGAAPCLAADLRTPWRRDEKNARMIFGA